jgi:hypothetical protein
MQLTGAYKKNTCLPDVTDCSLVDISNISEKPAAFIIMAQK